MATPNKATTKGPKQEHVIDASNQILGRLATQIAVLLQGKNTPDYLPRNAGNTVVVVKNAAKIKLSGKNKAEQKVYYRHTGYMGHLRTAKYKELMEKDAKRVLEMAVFNMLPKNWLRQRRMNRLKIEN
jgi:large subunit ribosomal protein L13